MSTKPVAVAGMHRTGTSMVTRALHDAGLHLLGEGADELIEAAEDNPEGFWENKAVVTCNDDLLEACGGAWDDPPDLPPQGADDPRVAHLVEAATAALDGLRREEPWGFKDPRLCLTASFWLDLEPELRFVICLRHPVEVAMSLKRRNQNSYALGLKLWEQYYRALLEAVPPERRIVTHYDAWFADAAAETERVCRFVGLEPVAPRVRADLRHHEVTVSLVDAGAPESLRRLYRDLCREAGVAPPPEPPPDAERVHRLVLDGAVAARHAEQRQAAIERLQEREAEFRAEIAQLRAEKSRLEAELRVRATAQAVSDRLGRRLDRLGRRLDRLEAQVRMPASERFARRALGAARRLSGPRGQVALSRLEPRARRVAARLAAVLRDPVGQGPSAARAAARRLPPGAQSTLRRGSDVLRDPVGEGPTAARAAARRLPPPARKALVEARRALLAARPRAVAAAKRLPPPAQDALRRARAAALHRIDRLAVSAGRRPAPRPPRGPAYEQWREAYLRLVATNVPHGERWLVATPGCPGEARLPGSTPFPTAAGKPLPDDLAHLARLEALRYEGHRWLVVPEGARRWFNQRAPELREHLTASHRLVADVPGAGIVFDLASRAEPDRRSLRAAITELTTGLDHEPVVLDWTTAGVGAELDGLTTFRPPVAGTVLPYADASIDVAVADTTRDVAEAMRVTTVGTVVVDAEADGRTAPVVEVLRTGTGSAADGAAPDRPPVVLWSPGGGGDPAWRVALDERAERAGARVRFDPLGDVPVGDLPDEAVLVLLEPGVLPLPGTVELLATAVAAEPDVAVGTKVLRGDGLLESAGGTVFSNRSVALVAHGTSDVRGPWHEYARWVCWTPGVLAAAAPVWRTVPPPASVPDARAFAREWCAHAWANGFGVRHLPGPAAVRVFGGGPEPAEPLPESAWQRVLDLRPPRPRRLGDGDWRYLLGRDDPEVCRG